MLGPDRERAGERYEALRARLLRFFAGRGSNRPEELTDESFDRVGRRLAGGEIVHTGDVGRYLLGVARNVLREEWSRDRRHGTGEAVDESLRAPAGSPGTEEASLACLDRCLEALAPETRDLVLGYYDWQGGEQLRQRRALAMRLGIGLNALRIRMHRLRSRLEDCTRTCLERGGEPTSPARPRAARETP
jgi:DNA-directed RNA polymerase specialized sigma24 family protein